MKAMSNPYPKIKNYGLWYPIQIRNRSLSYTLTNIFGSVYFASWGKSWAVAILPLVKHYIIWSDHVARTIHKKTIAGV